MFTEYLGRLKFHRNRLETFESETRDSFHKYICWFLCWEASKFFRHSSLTNFHLVLRNLNVGTDTHLTPQPSLLINVYQAICFQATFWRILRAEKRYVMLSWDFLTKFLSSSPFPFPSCISLMLNLLIDHLSLDHAIFWFNVLRAKIWLEE